MKTTEQLHRINVQSWEKKKKTHMIFNFGVSSGHYEQLDNLVPVETHCIVQGRVPFLSVKHIVDMK